jgi:hypothetical protein
MRARKIEGNFFMLTKLNGVFVAEPLTLKGKGDLNHYGVVVEPHLKKANELLKLMGDDPELCIVVHSDGVQLFNLTWG